MEPLGLVKMEKDPNHGVSREIWTNKSAQNELLERLRAMNKSVMKQGNQLKRLKKELSEEVKNSVALSNQLMDLKQTLESRLVDVLHVR